LRVLCCRTVKVAAAINVVIIQTHPRSEKAFQEEGTGVSSYQQAVQRTWQGAARPIMLFRHMSHNTKPMCNPTPTTLTYLTYVPTCNSPRTTHTAAPPGQPPTRRAAAGLDHPAAGSGLPWCAPAPASSGPAPYP
jgi:hypothetical protein